MHKIIKIAMVSLAFLLMTNSYILAATLELISAGGTTVGALISISTTDSTPTLVGKASPDATVDITINDLTVAVLADTDGDWTYTPISGLTDAAHTLKIASNLETLDYILLVDSGTSDTTTTTTTTTTTDVGTGGATESSSATLPVSGGVENTFLMIVGGLFLMGMGIVTQQVLPAELSEEIDETVLKEELSENDQEVY